MIKSNHYLIVSNFCTSLIYQHSKTWFWGAVQKREKQYLPIFVQDGLISLLQKPLQTHHLFLQLADEDEVVRSSWIHRLSNRTAAGFTRGDEDTWKTTRWHDFNERKTAQQQWCIDRPSFIRSITHLKRWPYSSLCVSTCLHWMASILVLVSSLEFPSEWRMICGCDDKSWNLKINTTETPWRSKVFAS